MKSTPCPRCGASVKVLASESPARSAPWINIVPRSLDQDEIDATVIPLKHALHIAVPTGLLVAVLFVLPDPSLSFEQRALGGGVAVGLATFIVVRSIAAVKNWEHLGWKLEQMFKIDLNRDKVIGEPPQPEAHNVTTSIQVEERAPNGYINRIKTLDWPCKPGDVAEIAKRLLAGKRTDVDWGRGQVLSVRKYKKVRKSLVDNGYAYWKNPNDHAQGWDLTVTGRRLLTSPPTPPAQV